MTNETTIKIPKKYEDKVDEVFQDSEGYWVEAADGFYFKGMDAHIAHEGNQKDMLAMIRTVAPCDCDECTKKVAN